MQWWLTQELVLLLLEKELRRNRDVGKELGRLGFDREMDQRSLVENMW